MKKAIALILCVSCLGMALAGCGSKPATEEPKKEEATTEATTETDADVDAPAKESDIVIGFSTGSSGSSFRTILENNFKEVADSYKEQGIIKDYKIVNNVTNKDAAEQANIIRDFINDSEINVIMLNPNSATDLNGVLSEAVEAGKTVVVLDCEVDVEGVTCVSINHYEWSKKAGEYIANVLQEGNAVQIYGGEGHPANNERIRATDDVLADYPDINLVASTTGGWNQQQAKEVATQLLSSGTEIDAIFTQDSMGAGILSAAMDLDKVPKVMFGECGTEYVNMAKELFDQGKPFEFCTQPNPPGISATALHIAVNLAQGKEFKPDVLGGLRGATYYYEVTSWFTDKDLDELVEIFKDEPDDYLLTEYLTQEEAAALFQ